MQTKELIARVVQMCQVPLVDTGCSLWDVTFEKEGTRHYLTVYIDKEGGVDTADCETVSRHIDPLLDGKDFDNLPAYVLSVSSAGLERHISRDEHLAWADGKKVSVTFYKAIDGQKTISDVLAGWDKDTITIGETTYNRSDVASVKLYFEF